MQLIEESSIKIDNLDTEDMSKYLAVMVSKKELQERGLSECIPARTVELEGAANRAPTVAYLDTNTYKERKQDGQGRVRTVERPKWSWA